MRFFLERPFSSMAGFVWRKVPLFSGVFGLVFSLGSLGALASPPEAARLGSQLVFHGWSPRSDYIAYERSQWGEGHRLIKTQRMHRKVEKGKLTGFGTKVGGDVATYAREHGYLYEPVAVERLSPTRFSFYVDGKLLSLDIEVDKGLGWGLSRGDERLFTHRFDKIYVDFDVEFYPSPDRRQGILVMHLRSGWDQDAAIYPIRLKLK